MSVCRRARPANSHSASPRGLWQGVRTIVTPWRRAPLTGTGVVTLIDGKQLNLGVDYVVTLRRWHLSAGVMEMHVARSRPVRYHMGVACRNHPPRAVFAAGNNAKQRTVALKYGPLAENEPAAFTDGVTMSLSVGFGSREFSDDVQQFEVLGDAEEQEVTLAVSAVDAHDTLYATFVAMNAAGQRSWQSVRVLSVDNTPPETTFVWLGSVDGHRAAQAEASEIAVYWRPFRDAESGVKLYTVSLECNSMGDLEEIAVASVNASLCCHQLFDKLRLPPGSRCQATVSATNFVGLDSKGQQSLSMVIDQTPPNGAFCRWDSTDSLVDNGWFHNDLNHWTTYGKVERVPDSIGLFTTGVVLAVTPEAGASLQQIVSLNVGTRYRLEFDAELDVSKGDGTAVLEASVGVEKATHVLAVSAESRDHVSGYQIVFVATSPSGLIRFSRLASALQSPVVMRKVSLHACQSGGSSTNAVSLSSRSLSANSVVSAAWTVWDPESDLTSLYWAIGTARGGAQLMPFTQLPPSSNHAHTPVQGLSHGSTVHVTLVARNPAGLASTFHAQTSVDRTPPVIGPVIDGPKTDLSHLTDQTITCRAPSANDRESGLAECAWGIGLAPGTTSVRAFQRFSTSTLQESVTLSSVPNGQRLYCVVTCVNGVGLRSTASSDGVLIFDGSTPVAAGVVTVGSPPGQGRRRFSSLPGELANRSGVLVQWSELIANSVGYQVKIDGVTGWRDSGLLRLHHFSDVVLSEKHFSVSVRAKLPTGEFSSALSQAGWVDTSAPSVTGEWNRGR